MGPPSQRPSRLLAFGGKCDDFPPCNCPHLLPDIRIFAKVVHSVLAKVAQIVQLIVEVTKGTTQSGRNKMALKVPLHRALPRRASWSLVRPFSSAGPASSRAQAPLAFLDFSKAPSISPHTFPLTVIPNFISEEEHNSFVQRAQKLLAGRRYEEGHWDEVISGFKEGQLTIERLAPELQAVAQRVFQLFPQDCQPMPHLHVLELAEHGVIDK